MDPNSLTDKQKKEIQKAYAMHVTPERPGISQVEARTALFSLGLNPTHIDVAKFWSDQDKPDDGLLDLEGFVCLRCTLDEDPRQTLRWAFNQFDTNGDGVIDKKELKRILVTIYDDKLGDLVDEEFVDDCLKMADVNGDGVLQIEEFVDMLMVRTGKDGSSATSSPVT